MVYIEELTYQTIEKFKEEILINMLEMFNLLTDIDRLEFSFKRITEKQRDQLYSHPILDDFDLLP